MVKNVNGYIAQNTGETDSLASVNVSGYITLNDGYQIPQIGLGVLRIDDDSVEDVVYNALKVGYRQIDGAAGYYNEKGVGRGIKRAIADGLVTRKEIWITSKVRDSMQGYESVFEAAKQTLDELQLEYLDLYMIHWPVPQQDKYLETWRAFEKLHADGLVRSIGVCNFLPEYLQRLLDNAQVKPSVNQLEIHPSFQQREAVEFTKEQGISVQAYSPMARGGDLNADIVTQIAHETGKTNAQVILKWHMQQGNIIIPKTTNPARMVENLETAGDWSLTNTQVQAISSLDRVDGSMGHDPHTYSYS